MTQPLKITTMDWKGNVSKVETENTEDEHATIVPGKKARLDEEVGSLVMQKLVKAKRADPSMTAADMEALRAKLVAEAESDGEAD